MAITKDDILETVGVMSVMELNDLVKTFEEKFGASAAAVAMADPAAAGSATVAEEQTEFTVTLKSTGTNKVGVIKAVYEITGLGLKEAKNLVNGAPRSMKEDVDKKAVDELVEKLAEAGAKAEAR